MDLNNNLVLPVAHGFFVRVSAGQTSGSLTIRNAQRLTAPDATNTPFQRGTADTRPLVQLELHGATGPADALYAYAQTGAISVFNPWFDAGKLVNLAGLYHKKTAIPMRVAVVFCAFLYHYLLFAYASSCSQRGCPSRQPAIISVYSGSCAHVPGVVFWL